MESVRLVLERLRNDLMIIILFMIIMVLDVVMVRFRVRRLCRCGVFK